MEFAVFSRRMLTGTISDLSPAIRIAWVTILFEAEKLRGRVKLPVRDLAKMASISTPEAAEALRVFQEPDPYSSSKEHDGRRLLPIDGEEDWYTVATWEKHAEERKQFFNRLRQQRARARNAKKDDVTDSNAASRDVTKEPEPEPEPTPSSNDEGEPGTDRAREAPDFGVAARVSLKIEASALRTKPPDQLIVAWVGKYGEELIVETLGDCEEEYRGKGWQYLRTILDTRLEDPSQRPAARKARRANGNGTGALHSSRIDQVNDMIATYAASHGARPRDSSKRLKWDAEFRNHFGFDPDAWKSGSSGEQDRLARGIFP